MASDCDWDFKFAFNNDDFSDRKLVIVVDDHSSNPELGACKDSVSESEREKQRSKRRKIDVMQEEDEGSNTTRTLMVSAAVLAAKSTFFSKLFSSGMKDSKEREVRLTIRPGEQFAFGEMIRFIYTEPLTVNRLVDLLQLLVLADRFGVDSCVSYSINRLQALPMTTESAIFYVELASSMSTIEPIKVLIDGAKTFLVDHFKDINNPELKEEFISLPLSVVEVILSSQYVEPTSEDALYHLLVQWLRANKKLIMEDPEDICRGLLKYIHFWDLSCKMLKSALSCEEFPHELASELVIEALFFKAEAPHIRISKAAKGAQRKCKLRPIQALMLNKPQPQCIVFIELTKIELEEIFSEDKIYSQAFHLGGRRSQLVVHRSIDQQNHSLLWLSLGVQGERSEKLDVEYEVACRVKPSALYYQRQGHGNCTYTGVQRCRIANLQWNDLMREDSNYFINNALCLRFTFSWAVPEDSGEDHSQITSKV